MSWKVLTSGPRPKIRLAKLEDGDREMSALKGTRQVYFPEYKGYVECPIYDRYRMKPGTELTGPAVVEERESTLVVGPGGRLRVDGHLNAIVEFS
ncbi:MAG: hypothetical protein ABIN58_02220 [candidate division WOR-3 bacterium]